MGCARVVCQLEVIDQWGGSKTLPTRETISMGEEGGTGGLIENSSRGSTEEEEEEPCTHGANRKRIPTDMCDKGDGPHRRRYPVPSQSWKTYVPCLSVRVDKSRFLPFLSPSVLIFQLPRIKVHVTLGPQVSDRSRHDEGQSVRKGNKTGEEEIRK